MMSFSPAGYTLDHYIPQINQVLSAHRGLLRNEVLQSVLTCDVDDDGHESLGFVMSCEDQNQLCFGGLSGDAHCGGRYA